MKTKLLIGIAVWGLIGIANATPVTFFGEDLTGTNGARTNSDAAHDSFMANLSGVGTEDFESFPANVTQPLTLDFGSTGTATLTGSGRIQNSSNTGRWATSGTNYWSAQTGDFNINFSEAVSAFGFYGTDIGDWGGSLKIEYSNGTSNILNVGNSIGANGNTNGSVLYFGFYEDDSSLAFTSVSFLNNSSTDVFGFDDMTIGSYEQIQPIPEPSSILLLGLGFLGLFGYSRKSRS